VQENTVEVLEIGGQASSGIMFTALLYIIQFHSVVAVFAVTASLNNQINIFVTVEKFCGLYLF